MDAVKDVGPSYSGATPLSTITIMRNGSLGERVTIAWQTVGCSASYAVIDPKHLLLLDGVLRLILSPRNTPTSASPQG
jgi:hypothetical protein